MAKGRSIRNAQGQKDIIQCCPGSENLYDLDDSWKFWHLLLLMWKALCKSTIISTWKWASTCAWRQL